MSWNMSYIFGLMGTDMFIAGTVVSWGGFLFGAAVPLLLCMKYPQVIAISLETALQNAGIAFVILKLSLPVPDSDLATLPMLAQLTVTSIPLWFLFFYVCIPKRWKRYKERKNKRKETTVDLDDTVANNLLESRNNKKDEPTDTLIT